MADNVAPPPRIVVGTDFSPASAAAAKLALETAERLGAEVHLVHVWQAPHIRGADLLVWVDGANVPLVAHAEKAAQAEFATLLEGLGETKVRVSTRFAVGRAVDVLTAESEQPGTVLLALGTHGAGWLERALVGSVASQVLRAASCPVLTVRK